MKARDWARAAKPLEEALAGFRPMRFGFVREAEWLAEGIYADSSAFRDDSFFVHAFVLPLFIPTEHVNLTYGFRIGAQWEVVDNRLVQAVTDSLPRLHQLGTLTGLVGLAQNWQGNVRHAELRLCVAVLDGDEVAIDTMISLLRTWRPQQQWEIDVLARSRALAELVENQGLEEASRELAARRTGVLEVLR